MKKPSFFIIMSAINLVVWGIVAFAYFYAYSNQGVKTELPDGKEELLKYIQTLQTYPELNSTSFWSGEITSDMQQKLMVANSATWSSYENCEKRTSDLEKKLCKNIFVSMSLEKLVNDKGMVKKEVCEEIEKRFWKNKQRDRCYMHYWTVMWDMTRNIDFCKNLPTSKEIWNMNKPKISSVDSFYQFDDDATRENCEFIVYYATIGSDEYNGTYLDRVKKSENEYDSVFYQKTLNKFWTYHYITRNKDPKEYTFLLDGSGAVFEKWQFETIKWIYDDMRSRFIIE